jgi:hypothetical protein
MSLVIRRSTIHADGVYTTTPIKRRHIVVEYTGPRLTNDQADAIYDNSQRTYLFGLTGGQHVIDGDGIAAFINHSCAPNCEADEIDGRVFIRAIRNIAAGEELITTFMTATLMTPLYAIAAHGIAGEACTRTGNEHDERAHDQERPRSRALAREISAV